MGNNDDSLKQQIYASMNMKDTHELLAIWEANDRESWSDETFEAIQAVLQNRGVEIPDLQMMLQYFDRASECHKSERYEEALAECDQLLELSPDWSAAHHLRGIILEDLYKDDEAIQEYQEAIRLNPSDKKFKKNLDSLLKSKEFAETLTDDSTKELTTEGNRDSLQRNIHASINAKDTHELLAIWESDDRDRWNYKIFNEINTVLHNRNVEIPDREMMQQCFDRIAESHQNNHYDEALALCDKLIEMVPDWSQAHNIKGVILEDLEREDEAIQEYQEAVRLNPRNKDAKKNLNYAIDYLKAQDNLYTPPPVEKSTSLTFEEKPFSEKPKIARKTYFIIMALVCYTLSFGNLFQFSDKYWNLPISILGIPTSFILQIIGGICAVGAIYSTWKMILELKYAGRLHVLFMDAVFECMFGSVFAIPFLGDPVLFIFSLIIIYILLIAINLQT
jgi:Flp pilus assembly protein TadD